MLRQRGLGGLGREWLVALAAALVQLGVVIRLRVAVARAVAAASGMRGGRGGNGRGGIGGVVSGRVGVALGGRGGRGFYGSGACTGGVLGLGWG